MDLKRVARNISSQWIAHVFTAAVGILMPPFLLGRLGVEGYGIHNLIGDLGGYSTMLYFGLGAAILKFVAEHDARDAQGELNETVSTIFAVYLRLGALCFVLAIALSYPLPWIFDVSPGLATAARARLVMMGAAIFAEFVGSVYGGVLMGVQRFDVLNGVKLAMLLARNAAIVTVMLTRPSVVAVGVVALASTVIEQGLNVVYAHRVMPGLRVSLALYRRERLRSLFTFSAQSFIFTMSDRLINYSDNIVISQAHGAAAGAVYAFPLRLVEFAREALDRATHVLMPGFSAAASRGEMGRVLNFWRTGNKLLLALALPIALVQALWGGHVLALWIGGNAGGDSARVIAVGFRCLQWLALAFVAQMAGRGLARPLFEGLGELKLPSRIALIEAAANLGLSMVLVRVWGLEGVAFATFAPAYVMGTVVMPWYACHRLGVSYARHMFETFVRALPPLVPAWGVLVAAERLGLHLHLLTLAATCVAVLVVYLCFAFLITFDDEEREGITNRVLGR
jgi:O-antigen/teichoic acid export membrane protein